MLENLDTLEISGENYGIFLTPLILSRLPSDIRMKWARDDTGKESDFERTSQISYERDSTSRKSRGVQRHGHFIYNCQTE
jgi:hypothetical protein